METVRRLQENPDLGEFRIHAALLQLGIKLSPRACGRILALNRTLYEPDRRHLRDVVPRQLFETQYHSPQLPLWELGDGDWLKVVRLRSSRRRLTHTDAICQLELFA